MSKPKKPYLSYTGFKTYNTCPEQYYQLYVNGNRPEVQDGRNTLTGNALHNLLEQYINNNDNNPEWLVDNAEEFWHKQVSREKLITWRNDADREFLLARMKKWSKSLADLLVEHDIDPVDYHAELKIDSDVKMNGQTVRLGGRIDLLKSREDGKYIFFDLKGSENRQIMQLDQIAWYALVLGIYLGDMEQPLAGGYILPGFKELKMYKVSMEDKKKLWLRIAETFKKIEAGEHPPKPESQTCFWCPVKEHCPIQVASLKSVNGTLTLG